MGTIARTSFSTGDIPTAAEWNTQFDTIYNEFNGSIEATNLASDAVTTIKILNDAVTIDKISTTVCGIETGAGAPSSTPRAVGDRYIDTTAKRWYIATGTSSSADWDKEAVFKSGTETVTAGGGDVTVTLPWDWSGGYVQVYFSLATAEWARNAANEDTGFICSYDSLTNAGYTTTSLIVVETGSDGHDVTLASTINVSGAPKAATSTTLTLKDDGVNTAYAKWFVWA